MVRVQQHHRQIIKKTAGEVREALCGPRGSGGMCVNSSDEIAKELRKMGIKAERRCGYFSPGCVSFGHKHDLGEPCGESCHGRPKPETYGLFHCWVWTPYGILDVTADQFDESLPKVWFPADDNCYIYDRPQETPIAQKERGE